MDSTTNLLPSASTNLLPSVFDQHTNLSSSSSTNLNGSVDIRQLLFHADEGGADLSALTIITVIGYLILIFITLAGNILVIAAFFRDPTLQAITNYWIISLALTDIILASTVMPIQVKRELTAGQKWTLGPFVCDLFISLDVLNCTCSIYHLGLISLDRYLCVRFPLWYPSFRSVRKTLWAILATWLWCTIISLPRFLFKNADAPNDECQMSEPGYMIFSSFMSFYIPLILCLVMYYGVFRITRTRSIKLKRERARSIPMGRPSLDLNNKPSTADNPAPREVQGPNGLIQAAPFSPAKKTSTCTVKDNNYCGGKTSAAQMVVKKEQTGKNNLRLFQFGSTIGKKQRNTEKKPETNQEEDNTDETDSMMTTPSDSTDRVVNSDPETDLYYHREQQNQYYQPEAASTKISTMNDVPTPAEKKAIIDYAKRRRHSISYISSAVHSRDPRIPRRSSRSPIIATRRQRLLSSDHQQQGRQRQQAPTAIFQRASTAGILPIVGGGKYYHSSRQQVYEEEEAVEEGLDDHEDNAAQDATTRPLVSPPTMSTTANNHQQHPSKLIELRRIQRFKQRISQTNFFANAGGVGVDGKSFDFPFSIAARSSNSHKTIPGGGVSGRQKIMHHQPVEKTASQKLRKKRQKQESRTAKIVVIVLGSFVALWLPFFLANVIWPACTMLLLTVKNKDGNGNKEGQPMGGNCGISENVWKIVTWLGYCNSAVNPFIYTYFNRTFRRAIFRIIRCDFTGSLNGPARR